MSLPLFVPFCENGPYAEYLNICLLTKNVDYFSKTKPQFCILKHVVYNLV